MLIEQALSEQVVGAMIELKSVPELNEVHEAQLLTYLKLSGIKIGYLVNFNVPVLKDGLRRRVN